MKKSYLKTISSAHLLEKKGTNFCYGNGIKKGSKKLEQLTILTTISLFGDTLRKDKEFKHDFNTERKMETENDDEVEEHHNLQNASFIVKTKTDAGTDNDEISKTNRRSSYLGAFFQQ